jgi:hypothetical protein
MPSYRTYYILFVVKYGVILTNITSLVESFSIKFKVEHVLEPFFRTLKDMF